MIRATDDRRHSQGLRAARHDDEDPRWPTAVRPAPQDDEERLTDERFLEEDQPGAPDPEYRRRRQPVRVRRSRGGDWGKWARQSWKPILYTAIVAGLAAGFNSFFFHSRWFVLESSEQIRIHGAGHTGTASIVTIFGGDLGRNVFFIPLQSRQRSLDALPWVRSASVLRLWPARLQVNVEERTPIVYGRAGNHLVLLDADGVVLPPPAQGQFNFPVLSGLAGLDAAQPNARSLIEQRHAAMRQYLDFEAALKTLGHDPLHDFSEVDLSNPDDLQARVSLPGETGSTILIHFGERNFAARYQLFLSQIANWRQQYPALVSVDLHFDGEAIVNPGTSNSQTNPRGKKARSSEAVGGQVKSRPSRKP